MSSGAPGLMGKKHPLVSAPHLIERSRPLPLGTSKTPFQEGWHWAPGQSPAADSPSAVSIQSQECSVFLKQRRASGKQTAHALMKGTVGWPAEWEKSGGTPGLWSPRLLGRLRPSCRLPHSLRCWWQEHRSHLSQAQGKASSCLGQQVPAVHSVLPLDPRWLLSPIVKVVEGNMARAPASEQMGQP